jgi:hypothetical protein
VADKQMKELPYIDEATEFPDNMWEKLKAHTRKIEAFCSKCNAPVSISARCEKCGSCGWYVNDGSLIGVGDCG